MGPLTLDRLETWTPHPAAMPLCEQDGERLRIRANGTRTLVGGWQVVLAGVRGGQRYGVTVDLSHEGVAVPRDQLRCSAHWCRLAPEARPALSGVNDDLLPRVVAPGRLRFERELTAPDGAEYLTLRYTLRWTAGGETHWRLPRIEALPAVAPRPPVRVAVVTGQMAQRGGINTVAGNVAFYRDRCEVACRAGAKLLVLPEIALQWAVPGQSLDLALPVPGPETDAFAALAREYGARICLGLWERDHDAVFNSAVLIAPTGEVDGRYHKVHLAADGEDTSGTLPGDGFPVYDTEVGRIGCNICMDSSATESSRMVGLNGADFLLLPIMGDHRADRWNMGSPIHNDSRWLAIQRTHAMDNQLCLVASRNTVQASCIIDRRGEVLAWNDGDQDLVMADVNLDDGYRVWTGGCFRGTNWMQRRPSVYGAFVDPECFGGV